MKRVITFGEIMLRLAPDGYLRFVQVDHLEALPVQCHEPPSIIHGVAKSQTRLSD